MAKQIKWIQVDDDTQVSVAIARPMTGSANPKLSGIEEKFDWGQWRYGTCDDSVTINSASNDNFIFEISNADYIADIKGKIDETVREWKLQAYSCEKSVREMQFEETRNGTVYSAAHYKYDAAVSFLSSATANAGLTTEANLRGISVTALATKIKNNHEAHITKEAQIAGLRGMLYDRICTIGINSTSVSTALASYAGIHTEEKIGTRATGIGTETEDIEVGFYNPSGLRERFEVEAGITNE